MSIFSLPEFKAFAGICSERKIELYAAVKLPGGGIKLFGDADQAIKVIEMAKNSKKRMSGVWIPPTSEITLQKQPLGVYFMNITSEISDFCIMLQNFVGKGKFGKSENGQCLILWWKLTALAKSNHKGSRQT